MWAVLSSRYVLVGLAIAVLVGAAFGFTYRKGYQASETKWKLSWAEFERDQAQLIAVQSEKYNRLLAKKHTQQAEIERVKREITLPSSACDSPEWVLKHNDAVRTLNGSP